MLKSQFISTKAVMLSVGTILNQTYHPLAIKELSFQPEINAQNTKVSFKIKYKSSKAQATPSQIYMAVFVNPNDVYDLRANSAGRKCVWRVRGCDSSRTRNLAPAANHQDEIQLIKNHFRTDSVVVLPTSLQDPETEVRLVINQVTSIEKGTFVYELTREAFFSSQPIPLVSSWVCLQDPRGIKGFILLGDWSNPGRKSIPQNSNRTIRVPVDASALSSELKVIMEVEDPTAALILREKLCADILGMRGYPMSLGFLPQPHIKESESFSNFGVVTILVLDRSGSMSGDREQKTITASRSLLNNLADGAKFAIVVFEGHGRVIVNITVKSPQTVESALNTLVANRSNGGTCFLEAFKTAYSLVPAQSSEVYHIIFLTDGEDGGSVPQCLCLIKENVAKNGTRVSCVGVTNGSCQTMDNTLRDLAMAGNGKYITMTDQSDSLDFANVFGMVAQQGMKHCTTNYQMSFDSNFILAVSGLLHPKDSIPAGQPLRFNLLVSEALTTTTEFVVEYDDSRYPQGRNRFKKVFLIMLQGAEYVVFDKEFQHITRELHEDILVRATPVYCPQVGLSNKSADPQDAQKCVLRQDQITKLQESHHTSIVNAGLQIDGVTAVAVECGANKGATSGQDSSNTSSTLVSCGDAIVNRQSRKKKRSEKSKGGEDAKLESFQNHPHRLLLQSLAKKTEAARGRVSTNKISEVHPNLSTEAFESLKKSLLAASRFKHVDAGIIHDVVCTGLARCFLVQSNLPFTRAAWELADRWISSQGSTDFSGVTQWLEHILKKLENKNWSHDPVLFESAIKEATAIHIADAQEIVQSTSVSNPFETDSTDGLDSQTDDSQLGFESDKLQWLIPHKAANLVRKIKHANWFVKAEELSTTLPFVGPKLAELSQSARSGLLLSLLLLIVMTLVAMVYFSFVQYYSPVLCTIPIWAIAVVFFPTIRQHHDQLRTQLMRVLVGSVLAYPLLRILAAVGNMGFVSNLIPGSFLLLTFELGYSIDVFLKFTISKPIIIKRNLKWVLAIILVILLLKDSLGNKEAGIESQTLSHTMFTFQLLLIAFGWVCCFPDGGSHQTQFLSLSNSEEITTSLTDGSALVIRQTKEALKDII